MSKSDRKVVTILKENSGGERLPNDIGQHIRGCGVGCWCWARVWRPEEGAKKSHAAGREEELAAGQS